jgi:outer membrane protein assembly factor BamB
LTAPSRLAHVTPQVADVGGRPQLLSGAGDVIQGFDPDTGERLWSVYSKGEGVAPSLVVGDGLVFSSSGFGPETIRAVRLDPAARGDITATHIQWEQQRAVPKLSSFLFHDGLLYTVKENGIALCLEAKTGKVVWQERFDGSYSASPVYAAGRIYYLAEDGVTTVIEPGPRFNRVAANPLEGTFQASPAISGGRIFIRSATHLFCLVEPTARAD